MDGGENRGFKAGFTFEGQALLKGRVKEKLKELMGEYSDDTLAVSAPPRSHRPNPHDPMLKP
jgi:hypothetical protein